MILTITLYSPGGHSPFSHISFATLCANTSDISTLDSLITSLTHGIPPPRIESNRLVCLLSPMLGQRDRSCVVLCTGPSSYEVEGAVETIQFGERVMKVRNVLSSGKKKIRVEKVFRAMKNVARECIRLKEGEMEEKEDKSQFWELVKVLANDDDLALEDMLEEEKKVDLPRNTFTAAVPMTADDAIITDNLSILADARAESTIIRSQNEVLRQERDALGDEVALSRRKITILENRLKGAKVDLEVSLFRENEAVAFLRRVRRFYCKIQKYHPGVGIEIPGAPDLTDLVDLDRLMIDAGILDEDDLENDDNSAIDYRRTAKSLQKSQKMVASNSTIDASPHEDEDNQTMTSRGTDHKDMSRHSPSGAAEDDSLEDETDVWWGRASASSSEDDSLADTVPDTSVPGIGTPKELELTADLREVTQRCIELGMELQQARAQIELLTNRSGSLTMRKVTQEAVALKKLCDGRTNELVTAMWKNQELSMTNKILNQKLANREQHVTFLEEGLREIQELHRETCEGMHEKEELMEEELEKQRNLVEILMRAGELQRLNKAEEDVIAMSELPTILFRQRNSSVDSFSEDDNDPIKVLALKEIAQSNQLAAACRAKEIQEKAKQDQMQWEAERVEWKAKEVALEEQFVFKEKEWKAERLVWKNKVTQWNEVEKEWEVKKQAEIKEAIDLREKKWDTERMNWQKKEMLWKVKQVEWEAKGAAEVKKLIEAREMEWKAERTDWQKKELLWKQKNSEFQLAKFATEDTQNSKEEIYKLIAETEGKATEKAEKAAAAEILKIQQESDQQIMLSLRLTREKFRLELQEEVRQEIQETTGTEHEAEIEKLKSEWYSKESEWHALEVDRVLKSEEIETKMEMMEIEKNQLKKDAEEMKKFYSAKLTEMERAQLEEQERLLKEILVKADEEKAQVKSHWISKEEQWYSDLERTKTHHEAQLNSIKSELELFKGKAERLSNDLEKKNSQHSQQLDQVRKEVTKHTREVEENARQEHAKELSKVKALWTAKNAEWTKKEAEFETRYKTLESLKFEAEAAEKVAIAAKLESEKAAKEALKIYKNPAESTKLKNQKSSKELEEQFTHQIMAINREWSAKELEWKRKESFERSTREANVAAKFDIDVERRHALAEKIELERLLAKEKEDSAQKLRKYEELQEVEISQKVREAKELVKSELEEEIRRLINILDEKENMWRVKETEMILQLAEEKVKTEKAEAKELANIKTQIKRKEVINQVEVTGNQRLLSGQITSANEILPTSEPQESMQSILSFEQTSCIGSANGTGSNTNSTSIRYYLAGNVDVTIFHGGKLPEYKPMHFAQKIGPLIKPAVMRGRSKKSRRNDTKSSKLIEV
mmetsp:Transcript_5979/g.12749  ORF Transcript_5979/g.12749 Transcript_5979/m.12749 type:complete len:1354 (-) Transcript_5979:27-4088(-)